MAVSARAIFRLFAHPEKCKKRRALNGQDKKRHNRAFFGSNCRYHRRSSRHSSSRREEEEDQGLSRERFSYSRTTVQNSRKERDHFSLPRSIPSLVSSWQNPSSSPSLASSLTSFLISRRSSIASRSTLWLAFPLAFLPRKHPQRLCLSLKNLTQDNQVRTAAPPAPPSVSPAAGHP